MGVQLESFSESLARDDGGLPLALEELQRRIKLGFSHRLEGAHLGLTRERYREFRGNYRAFGRTLEHRLVVPSWGEADHADYWRERFEAASGVPRLRLGNPLAFGYELGVAAHAQLYPCHGRRDAVAELCALLHLFISLFDWVTDCSPAGLVELSSVFSEETLRRLAAGLPGVRDFQEEIETVRNHDVRITLKTIGAFFANLHAAARVPADSPPWKALERLLVQAYRAEVVATGLSHLQPSPSEDLAAAKDKSVLPFEIMVAIAAVCEDQPAAGNMDDAFGLVRSIGTMVSLADDVADLLNDYSSGDANTVLLAFATRVPGGYEAAGETLGGDSPVHAEEFADRVARRLYDSVTRALSFADSASDQTTVQRVRDVIVGYGQGWLKLTGLRQHPDAAGSEKGMLRRALLTDAVAIAEGARRNGDPCPAPTDLRAALLRDDILQIVVRGLWRKLRHHRPNALCGVSPSAGPIVAGLALRAQSEQLPLKCFTIGPCGRIEGAEPDSEDRVALVDGAIGDGDDSCSALESVERSRSRVAVAAYVVNLQESGAARVRDCGVPVETLITPGELGLMVRSPLLPHLWKPVWTLDGVYDSRYGAPKSLPSSADGLIYVGSDMGYVACLTSAGDERWRFETQGPRGVVHALACGKRVFACASGGFAYCLDAQSGLVQWETRCAIGVVTSPASSPNGGVAYFSGSSEEGGGTVVALAAETGSELWRSEIPARIECSPSFDANGGRVAIGADDGCVYALDALTGEVAWRFRAGDAVKGAVATDASGRWFAGAADGRLYALDANSGALHWKKKISHSLYTRPLLCGDMVVSGGDSKRVAALKADSGEVCWVATLRGSHTGGATLVAGKWIALGCDAGTVYLLDRENGFTVWSYNTAGSIRSTPAVAGDRLLTPSSDGRLYCFGYSAEDEI